MINTKNPPPTDWPKGYALVVHEHELPGDMVAQCESWGVSAPGYPILTQLFGCARFRFCTTPMRCEISITKGEADFVMAHERMHCDGWDHIGSASFRDAWIAYKVNPRAYCEAKANGN